jgi:hypothetical protein
MHRGLFVATLLLIAPCAAAQVQCCGTLGIYSVWTKFVKVVTILREQCCVAPNRYDGGHTSCTPNPCTPFKPTETWGNVKILNK